MLTPKAVLKGLLKIRTLRPSLQTFPICESKTWTGIVTLLTNVRMKNYAFLEIAVNSNPEERESSANH